MMYLYFATRKSYENGIIKTVIINIINVAYSENKTRREDLKTLEQN